MSLNIVAEYQSQLARLQLERDIVWGLLVDQEQFNQNVSREVAELRVSQEVFQRLQQAGAL